MKKFLIFVLSILFLYIPSYSFAQEEGVSLEEDVLIADEEVTEEVDPISPDSPFYFLTELFEDVQLLLTFDEDQKVQKALEFAQKKLNGMENLNGEEDPKLMERLEKRFEKLVENAERVSQDEDAMQEDSLEKIEQIRERHLNVLNTVLEKAPEGQAQESIQKVIDKTVEKYNAKDEKVKTNNKGGVVKEDKDDEDVEEEIEEEIEEEDLD